MRWPIVAAAMACLPLMAFAQQPLVLSGEHEGFTRIVAPLATGQDWSVEQQGRSVTLSVTGAENGFDTRRVFDLIPRSRVRQIAPGLGQLEIELGCDCRIAPFVFDDRFVVLDIADPGVSRPVAFVPVTSPPEEGTPQAEAPAPIEPIRLPIASSSSARLLQESLVPLALPDLVRQPLDQQEQETLNQVQEQLARELGLATTRGLLSLKPGASLRGVVPDPPEEQLDPEPAEPEISAAAVATPNNMRVTSSMDFPGLSARPKEPQSLSGFSCPPNADVDIATWADDRPFDQQMGQARQDLYQEFDRLDAATAVNLARLYLHFGFGAEAYQILTLSPDVSQSQRILIDIAEIMEKGHAPPDSTLPALLDCESDIALWAILARKKLTVAHQIDPSSALRALNRLPIHLRQFLAPALSERLLSHGDTDAAATALRSLERLPADLSSSAKFAQAKIALDEGLIDQGEARLEDVIDDNTQQSPEALITLVETRLAANQPIDPTTAGLIEAYAKEFQGSDLGAGLRRAHVLALAKSDQFDLAFQALSELGGDGEDEAAINLRLQLIQELTTSAADVVFLDHLFQQSQRDIAQLPKRPKLTLAGRLQDLGFAAQAQEILAGMPLRPRSAERQLLAARSALALQQPQRALAELEELTGKDVDLLRAQANQMAGSYAQAYQFFRSAEQIQEAAQSAWLADDTTNLTLEKDPLFGPVLALSDQGIPGPDATDPNGMLARITATLEESETARGALRDFLRSPEIGIGEDDTAE